MSARNPALSCDVDTQACDAKIAVRKGQVVAGGGGVGGGVHWLQWDSDILRAHESICLEGGKRGDVPERQQNKG